MKTSKRNRWLSFLLTLVMLFGMLPLASLLPTQAAAASYPKFLNKLVEGKLIYEGYRYRFYSSGRVESYTYNINPSYTDYSSLLEFVKKEPDLVKYVAYSNGVLLYWTKSEDDFLDLSEFKGLPLSLRLFDNMTLSAIYAPGVDLTLGLYKEAYVKLRHSTRYKDKTGYCPQNGTTGAVIDLAQTEGNLGNCGTFELCGNGDLYINTRNAPKKSSPDYAIVAKSTAIREDAELGIACGNSHRQVVSLIQTTGLTVDTTKSVHFGIYNTFAVASAWSCHMNSCSFLNARDIYVRSALGSSYWKIFGDNGESDPVKVFKNYQKSGKIGEEWAMRGNTESNNQYLFTMDHKNDQPRLQFTINNEVLGDSTMTGLTAGLGYPISAKIRYMPRWLQKLKDAGRVEFYFFARLRDGTGNYEAAYLNDFYVDRTGTHTVQFYWLCLPKSDSDCANFNSESTLLNYDIVQGKTLYFTLSAHTIYMEEQVSSRYIWNVKFQQDGGEFTEATNASHKISLTSESFAVCYPNRTAPIPSEWSYNSSDDAYYMYFWVHARHGYKFAPQVTNASGTVLLNNVQYTEVSKKELSSDNKTLYITLIAKRKLTEVRGTLKNFRFGVDSWFTEIVSNEPKKYTFPSTVVYDTSYSGYGVEAGQLDDGVLYYIYFDVNIGKGYYLPANAPVKVIQPEGYRANGMFDRAQTYSSVYKGAWYSDTPISQKYRTESRLEANCEGKEYWPYIEIKQPVPGDSPAGSADYSQPTSLPANMKVLSMQWLKDGKPMGTTDKFELGKSYIIDLRIGFEGGKEMGHIYPINERDFKVNGKSMNAWLDHMDFTDGHVWHLSDSYEAVDPSTLGSITGKINSFNSASDMVTIQLFKSGYSSATYTASVSGNPASYTLPGIPFGTYTMKVSKKDHATREYKITLGAQAAIQNVQLRLKADLDANGAVNLADVRQFIAEISSGTAADSYEKAVRDYNSDGKADLSDVRAIILAIAGGN